MSLPEAVRKFEEMGRRPRPKYVFVSPKMYRWLSGMDLVQARPRLSRMLSDALGWTKRFR